MDLAEVAGRFGHVLHASGIPVTPERSGRFVRAIQLAAPSTTRELYWTARVSLLSDPTQIEIFDRIFAQVFEGFVDPADHRSDAGEPIPSEAGETRSPEAQDEDDPATVDTPKPSPSPVPTDADDNSGDSDDDDGEETILAAVSDEERLRHRDFASLDDAELRRLRRLFAQIRLAPPPRTVRRTIRHRRGDQLDLRRTLARAHRTAGDAVTRVHRRRRTQPRRLVLLCDISGSMEPYSRAYLQLLHSAVGGARAEAFVFATRLTRLTRMLRTRDPDLALRQAGQAAPDWSGGTRIGLALQRFLDGYGRRGMARGAIVVIVSDGWERGDPEHLGEQMARLKRLAHRIVWINPRSANPRYEPLVGGIAAALPYIDTFVSGHSIAALDEVLTAIAEA